MAINQKDSFVSIKQIIAKVYRDLNLKEEDRFYDMIEWIAEAMEFISSPEYLQPKEACLGISQYKAELPCDLVEILQVSCGGSPLRLSTAHVVTKTKDNGGAGFNTLNNPPYNQLAGDVTITGTSQLGGVPGSYELVPGFIKTSFRDGEVTVFYKGILTDDEGYPLIPNEQNAKEALFWYCFSKMLLGGFDHPTVRYADAQHMWEKYCGQAFTKSIVPTLDQLENIKRAYLSHVPNLKASSSFFEDMGSKRGLFGSSI